MPLSDLTTVMAGLYRPKPIKPEPGNQDGTRIHKLFPPKSVDTIRFSSAQSPVARFADGLFDQLKIPADIRQKMNASGEKALRFYLASGGNMDKLLRGFKDRGIQVYTRKELPWLEEALKTERAHAALLVPKAVYTGVPHQYPSSTPDTEPKERLKALLQMCENTKTMALLLPNLKKTEHILHEGLHHFQFAEGLFTLDAANINAVGQFLEHKALVSILSQSPIPDTLAFSLAMRDPESPEKIRKASGRYRLSGTEKAGAVLNWVRELQTYLFLYENKVALQQVFPHWKLRDDNRFDIWFFTHMIASVQGISLDNAQLLKDINAVSCKPTLLNKLKFRLGL